MAFSPDVLHTGLDRDTDLRALDALHAYHMLVMHWAYAVHDRLEGMATFLLAEELEEVADENFKAARRIAVRVADLEASVTADPRQFVSLSPLSEFQLPRGFSDVNAILGCAMEMLDLVIGEYESLLNSVRGRDDLTHQLVVQLVGEQVRRRADIRAALTPR